MSLDLDPPSRPAPPPVLDADAAEIAGHDAFPDLERSRPGTRAADGFLRRAFTVEDCARMQDAGIIGPGERYELIEGDLVVMQAKHRLHERIKLALNRQLSRCLPDHLQLGVETSLYLSGHTFLDPDLSVFPMAIDTQAVRGPDVLLAIEVAHTTLDYDLGLKSRLYARYGVQELWVIDAASLRTRVQRTPIDAQWTEVVTLEGDVPLTHSTAPGFSLALVSL